MLKQSPFLKKVNFCVSRVIIAGALLLTAMLYMLVAKNYIKAPQFVVSTLKAAAPSNAATTNIEVSNTQELLALFDEHDYSLEAANSKDSAIEIPAIYLSTLPDDFAKNLTISEKKEIFMKTLLPLILEANAEIEQEREKLIALKELIDNEGHILESQRAWLETIADKYRVKKFTYNDKEKLNTLIARVDVIPVAMAMGQAIEEAGWGRSHAARIKNATHGVTLPSGVKAYDSLAISVKSYMRNLNANPAYIKMRKIRSDLRAQNKDLCGVKMMDGLYHYSELRNAYIRKVKKHITHHNLVRFEDAQLKDVQLSS